MTRPSHFMKSCQFWPLDKTLLCGLKGFTHVYPLLEVASSTKLSICISKLKKLRCGKIF